ncbi:MAG: hypothetical protein DMF51_05300 [Acidobacteria bacterium]|nr:MAG: hypothetical protein DMF51_05300 [Acidobacteriota bacterium]
MKVVVHLLRHLSFGVVKNVQQQMRASQDRDDIRLFHTRQDFDQVRNAALSGAAPEILVLVGPFLGAREGDSHTACPEDPAVVETA